MTAHRGTCRARVAALVLFSGVAAISTTGIANAQDANAPTLWVDNDLCRTSLQAKAYEALLVSGENSEMAADRIARHYKTQVCGRYSGRAVIDESRVEVAADGFLYRLTKFRFLDDDAIAWAAQRSFAPSSGTQAP
jgi:ABC-type sugar transport system substrate-binding protein